jgi:hypothetical protein
MKRNLKTKLRLDRETLAPLQSQELDQVNGGVKETGCLSQCTQCPSRPPISRPQGPLSRASLGGGDSLGG